MKRQGRTKEKKPKELNQERLNQNFLPSSEEKKACELQLGIVEPDEMMGEIVFQGQLGGKKLKNEKQKKHTFRFGNFQPWILPRKSQAAHFEEQFSSNSAKVEDSEEELNEDISDEEEYFEIPRKPDPEAFADNRIDEMVFISKKTPHQNNPSNFRKARTCDKGLRNLSKRAFDIVVNLKQATYKQVALELIDWLQSPEEFDDEMNGSCIKDENNINRRVYDALNVLISINILQKKGKLIIYQEKEKEEEQNSESFKKLKRAQTMFEEVEKRTTKQKQELESLKQKKVLLSKVLSRNEKVKNENCDEKVAFPFVCLSLNEDSLETVEISEDKEKFIVLTVEGYQFFGDVDSLTKLPIEKLN